jgi:predicted nucleotidyltransferase
MPTPMLSLRAPAEQHALLRRIGQKLKQDPGLAAALTRLISGQAVTAPIGAFRDEAAALGFIRDRLTFALKPDAIWLFGSRARGDHRSESDFDILAVLPDGLPPQDYDAQRAVEALAGSGLGCDVVLCSRTEFEAGGQLPDSLAATVLREGRLLYRARRRAAKP